MFEGNISSPLGPHNSALLTVIFENNLKNIGIDSIDISSENNFSFRLEKKLKISNFKVESQINLKKLIYKKKSNILKNHITDYKDSIELTDHKIQISDTNVENLAVKEAFKLKDAPGMVDGIIDLCVFAIGTLEVFGVDAQKAWDEVYKANMSKEAGINIDTID